MTVSSATSKVSYAGNGSLTSFAYTFKVFDQDDLTVIIRASNGTETVKTITTDYTVTNVGNASGGNVVFTTAPATGETVVILREMDLEQGLDLVPNDPFPAQSLEESLDKLTFITQQHSEELGRTVKASRTNTLAGGEFTISAADRANKVFAFDSAGDVSITQELGTWRGNWTTGTQYYERDLVRDNNRGDVYIVNTAHVSTGSESDYLYNNINASYYDVVLNAYDFTAFNLTVDGTTDPIYGGFKVINGVPARFSGDVQLGDDTNDVIEILGRVESDIEPRGTQDIGSTTNPWDHVFCNDLITEQNVLVKTNLTVRGDTLLGQGVGTGDDVTINANIASDLIPKDTETHDLGSSTKRWDQAHVEDGYFTRVYTQQLRSETNGALEVRHEHASTPLRFILDDAPVRYEMGVNSTRKFQISKPFDGFSSPNVFFMYEPTDARDWNFAVGESSVSALDWTIQSGNTGVDTVLHGDLSTDGDMNIDGTTGSTAVGTGALVVDGGASIAENLWIGGYAQVAGALTVNGSLVVNGTTTTVNTTNATYTDTLIELGTGRIGTSGSDSGIVIERGNQDNAFIGFDEQVDKFIVGTGSFTGASTGALSVTTGTLVANIEGDVAGNLNGNIGTTTPGSGSFTTISASTSITGDLTGNVKGNSYTTSGQLILNVGTNGTDATITADVTGDVTGNVTGNLTGDLVEATTDTKALAPDTDSAYDIGTSALRYRTAYVDKHYFTETVETTYSITPSATTVTVNPYYGNIQYVTLNNNLSLGLSGWETGQTVTLMIDDGTNYSLTWPLITWVNNNGSNPTLKTSGYTVVTIWYVNSVYYGAVVGAA